MEEFEEKLKRILSYNKQITVELERDDYAVEERGYNLEITESEIIVWKYPNTKVVFNKSNWNKVKILYKKPDKG